MLFIYPSSFSPLSSHFALPPYHATSPLTFLLIPYPPFLTITPKASSSLQGCDLASFLLAVEDAADQDAFILGPGSSICHIASYPVTPLPSSCLFLSLLIPSCISSSLFLSHTIPSHSMLLHRIPIPLCSFDLSAFFSFL